MALAKTVNEELKPLISPKCLGPKNLMKVRLDNTPHKPPPIPKPSRQPAMLLHPA